MDYVWPVAFALFVWWFGTGAILFLDRLPRRTIRWSMLGTTALLALGLAGLARSADDTSVSGAYTAFTGAILVWAWNEMGFLSGWITGPRTTPSPAGTPFWRRTRHAVEAILYHELALLASGLAIAFATLPGENRIGLLTFAVLWTMRLSAKLNLYLGVPNSGEEFLPDHLRYMASWFTRGPMNPFFPGMLILAGAALALVVSLALRPDAAPGEVVGLTLVGTLLALAVLEHLMLVLPIPAAALWQWAGTAARVPFRAAAGAPSRVSPSPVQKSPLRRPT